MEFIIKGNFLFTKSSNTITCKNGYIVVNNGTIQHFFDILPSDYLGFSIIEYKNSFIIPGFCDLHTHAPQFESMGVGMNKKLLPWLSTVTFPTEIKYADETYAKDMYIKVVNELVKHGTTRVVMFGTIHKQSTQILVDLLEKTGLYGFVGKVNMDRNAPEKLQETTKDSISSTIQFIEKNINNTKIKPIITPRFIPSCTSVLLNKLGELAKKYNLPIQSHINENLDEIDWVSELCPSSTSYTDAYYDYGLLTEKTLMAHCIHMKLEEINLFKKIGAYAIHCPHSNTNLSSGIMPIKSFLDQGLNLGFGSDISGGNEVSIAKAMILAMQLSKIRYIDYPEEGFLTLSEAFYIATKGGGRFFGKVGSFEEGYEFDALVIQDEFHDSELSFEDRVSKFIYTGDDRNIIERFVKGKKIHFGEIK